MSCPLVPATFSVGKAVQIPKNNSSCLVIFFFFFADNLALGSFRLVLWEVDSLRLAQSYWMAWPVMTSEGYIYVLIIFSCIKLAASFFFGFLA